MSHVFFNPLLDRTMLHVELKGISTQHRGHLGQKYSN